MLSHFSHITNPRFFFGAGNINKLPEILSDAAQNEILLISGRHFQSSAEWAIIQSELTKNHWNFALETITQEPSPQMIDEITRKFRQLNMEQGSTRSATTPASSTKEKEFIVIAIGGGSVLDAGKAIAAMLHHEGSVTDYLEGVGTRTPTGKTAPMIALPTTAGTGSEATKNAVITQHGTPSFKKSLRHDNFVPQTVIIDPNLALNCPPDITLACGMDTLCQLIASYLSTDATPLTDTIALEGLSEFNAGSGLIDMFGDTGDSGKAGNSDNFDVARNSNNPQAGELEYRGHLALAAYYSGITLANANLGTVHGIASPLGATCTIPHGVACGLLLAPVLQRIHSKAILENKTPTLEKLARIARIVIPDSSNPKDLIQRIRTWTQPLPSLSHFGLSENTLESIAIQSDNKKSPISFNQQERREIIQEVF